MKKTLFFALLILSSMLFSLNSYEVDKIVNSVPIKHQLSLKKLCNYFNTQFFTDEEKARAAYTWVAKKTRYDEWALRGNYQVNDEAEHVYKARQALCGGFANLYAEICKRLGLKVEVIYGLTKSFEYTDGKKINHAWNAVEIDGKWFLIDTTWAAGYLDEKQQFIYDFNDYYYKTNPNEFIYSHFPEKTKWQLLNTEITRNEFDNFANYNARFFVLGFEPMIDILNINYCKQPFTFYLNTNKQIEAGFIKVLIEKNDKTYEQYYSRVSKTQSSIKIEIDFFEKGINTVYVLADTGNGKTYGEILRFDVKSEYNFAGGYPFLANNFADYGLRLTSKFKGIQHINNATVNYKFANNPNYFLRAVLYKNSKRVDEKQCFSTQYSSFISFDIAFNEIGKYELKFFAAKTAGGVLTEIASAELNAKQKTSKTFPFYYPSFKNCELISPKYNSLTTGIHSFKVKSNNYNKMAILADGQLHPMKKNGNIFALDFEVKTKKVTIVAKNNKDYKYILDYEKEN